MGRAIVRNPQVFLFDEPLSNLDAKLRVQMRSEIKALHQRLKVTTVYVTHDQIEAMTMADKIVVMNSGVIEQAGPPLDLYDRPANLFVAGFIGSPAMNMLDGQIADGRFRGQDGTHMGVARAAARASMAAPILYGIRPEHLRLDQQGMPATVQCSSSRRARRRRCCCASASQSDDRRLPRAHHGAARRDCCRVSPDPALIHLFDQAIRPTPLKHGRQQRKRRNDAWRNHHAARRAPPHGRRRRGARAGRPGRRADPARRRGRAQAAHREGRQPAHPAPRPLRRARRGALPRQHRQVPAGDRHRDARRLRRLGGHAPAVGCRRQHRHRPRHHHRLVARTRTSTPTRSSSCRDLAEYLGKRYGGWTFLAEKYGKKDKTNNWLAIPFGGGTGPICYRKSAVKEAGFDAIPNDHATYLKLLQALKKNNKPAGFALGNAVGDGNGFANWLVWSHGAYLVDEAGKVAINSKETIDALKYLKDLYPTFVPGTLSWGDPSNNRAYAANECWLTANGVSLYYALKNDPATRAIAEDTEHAPLPYGVVGKPPQASLILNGMVFKHTKFPNAAKAYIQFMMEAEQYDPVAHRLPRLLVAHAQGLQQQRGLEVRSQARALPDGDREPVLVGLQGADHARRRRRRRRVHHGADVRLRGLRPGDAGGGGQGGRAPHQALLPLTDHVAPPGRR